MSNHITRPIYLSYHKIRKKIKNKEKQWMIKEEKTEQLQMISKAEVIQMKWLSKYRKIDYKKQKLQSYQLEEHPFPMSHRKDSQRYYTEAGQNYSQVEQLRIEGFVQSKLQHLHDQPGFNGIDNTGFSFNNCKQNRHHKTKGIAIKKYNTYKEDEERNKHQNLECFQQLERILVMQNKNLKEQNSYLLTYIEKIANKNHLLKQQLQSSLASNKLLQENLIKLEHNFVLLRQECERKMQVIVNKWIIYEKGVQKSKRISWMKSSSLTNQGEAMSIQSNMVCSMGNIKGLFHLKDRSGNRDSVDSRKVEEMTIKDYLTRCQTKIQSEALISFGVRHNKNLIKQSHIHYMPDTCSIQDMGNLSRARP